MPMKDFDSKDISHLGFGAQLNLSDVRFLMGCIDRMAVTKGRPPKSSMTCVEANACHFAGQDGIEIDARTKSGRHRNKGKLTWSSVLRLMKNRKRPSS